MPPKKKRGGPAVPLETNGDGTEIPSGEEENILGDEPEDEAR